MHCIMLVSWSSEVVTEAAAGDLKGDLWRVEARAFVHLCARVRACVRVRARVSARERMHAVREVVMPDQRQVRDSAAGTDGGGP